MFRGVPRRFYACLKCATSGFFRAFCPHDRTLPASSPIAQHCLPSSRHRDIHHSIFERIDRVMAHQASVSFRHLLDHLCRIVSGAKGRFCASGGGWEAQHAIHIVFQQALLRPTRRHAASQDGAAWPAHSTRRQCAWQTQSRLTRFPDRTDANVRTMTKSDASSKSATWTEEESVGLHRTHGCGSTVTSRATRQRRGVSAGRTVCCPERPKHGDLPVPPRVICASLGGGPTGRPTVDAFHARRSREAASSANMVTPLDEDNGLRWLYDKVLSRYAGLASAVRAESP